MHFYIFSSADTEKFYTEVQEIILSRFNKTFDWSLKARMMGMKAIEAAKVFVEETGISDSLSAEQFLVEREDMLQKLFPSSELMPGTRKWRIVIHVKLFSIFFIPLDVVPFQSLLISICLDTLLAICTL